MKLFKMSTQKKRYKYLSHFPIGCIFRFCLVDISKYLSEDNIYDFKNEIFERQQKQIQTQKEQEKRDKYFELKAKEKQEIERKNNQFSVSQSYWFEKYPEEEFSNDQKKIFHIYLTITTNLKKGFKTL